MADMEDLRPDASLGCSELQAPRRIFVPPEKREPTRTLRCRTKAAGRFTRRHYIRDPRTQSGPSRRKPVALPPPLLARSRRGRACDDAPQALSATADATLRQPTLAHG